VKITILQGDVLESLQTLPSESIDCIMTSPPYWALRDYGVEGQIGLETTFEEYIEKMLRVTAELKKVLKKTGTFWLNIGDTYANSMSHSDWTSSNPEVEKHFGDKKRMNQFTLLRVTNLPQKCLTMVPERLALGMMEQGWILRNKIVWYKPNHMPSSVKDRFSNAWEYLYFFVKNRDYYFDLDSIREPHKGKPSGNTARKLPDAHLMTGHRGTSVPWKPGSVGKNPGDVIKHDEAVGRMGNLSYDDPLHTRPEHHLGKNPSDFWEITTKPFPDSHFAVFPEELCEKPIKAGCPNDGTVLDPFAGSGTVGKVAIEQKKSAVLVELKPNYCDMIKKRLNWGSPFMKWEFKVIE
jgi:DNA modification methylase